MGFFFLINMNNANSFSIEETRTLIITKFWPYFRKGPCNWTLAPKALCVLDYKFCQNSTLSFSNGRATQCPTTRQHIIYKESSKLSCKKATNYYSIFFFSTIKGWWRGLQRETIFHKLSSKPPNFLTHFSSLSHL